MSDIIEVSQKMVLVIIGGISLLGWVVLLPVPIPAFPLLLIAGYCFHKVIFD